MRKKKLSLISSAFLVGLFCILGTTVLAQTSPADCKLGCTSNDVQIKSAYLSDINGNKLSSSFVCPQSGTATVYLTLELTTKTPRVGVVIYANIKNFTGGVVGSTIATPSRRSMAVRAGATAGEHPSSRHGVAAPRTLPSTC